jgi:hypothetical protein
MFEYKSEIVKFPIRLFKSTINEAQISHLDELINTRAAEGWELVAHSLSSNDLESAYHMIVTFRKKK